MSPWMKWALMIFFLNTVHTAQAQTFPYEVQFHRLMGEPKETVSAFVMYPWPDHVQADFTKPGQRHLTASAFAVGDCSPGPRPGLASSPVSSRFCIEGMATAKYPSGHTSTKVSLKYKRNADLSPDGPPRACGWLKSPLLHRVNGRGI